MQNLTPEMDVRGAAASVASMTAASGCVAELGPPRTFDWSRLDCRFKESFLVIFFSVSFFSLGRTFFAIESVLKGVDIDSIEATEADINECGFEMEGTSELMDFKERTRDGMCDSLGRGIAVDFRPECSILARSTYSDALQENGLLHWKTRGERLLHWKTRGERRLTGTFTQDGEMAGPRVSQPQDVCRHARVPFEQATCTVS